jgi:D-alanine-D-alanine ligase-like ATP-grasp enzyme
MTVAVVSLEDPKLNAKLAITIARAMTLKLPLAKEVATNFAVHLESRTAGRVVHGLAEGVVTRFQALDLSTGLWGIIDTACQKVTRRNLQSYRNGFPEQIWPVAEELCRALACQSLDGHNLKQFLSSAAADAAQRLEAAGHVELADGLLELLHPNSQGAPLLPVRLGIKLRKWLLKKRLVRLLGVFETALERLHKTPDYSSGLVGSIYPDHWLDRFAHNCCFPEPPLPAFNGRLANLYGDAAFLHDHPKDATKGHLVEREALSYGLSILRFPNGSFIAYDRNGAQLNFKWSRSPVSSAVSLALCCHKDATRAVLRRRGLPVPRGRVFAGGDYEGAAAYAKRLAYPVVLKPAAGLRGIGVISNIQNEGELQEAFKVYTQSELGLDDFVIEQHVRGRDYRIVVVGKRVVSAICREPASVLGDGLHTVIDLVLFKNRIRMLNPHLRRRPISLDDGALYKLRRSQLTIHSVPEKGQRVELANSSNISRGGDSIEIVDELHPSLKDIAIHAVEAIPGLGFCGLDMLLEDHATPAERQSVAIIELNAHGAIGTGQYPMWGTPQNVARRLLLYCAELKGVELNDSPAIRLSMNLEIRGKVGPRYRQWFTRKANEFGLQGWISTASGLTVAEIEGETAPVAALVNAAVRGPGRSVPFWVRAEHVNPRGYSSFENRLNVGS